MLIMMKTDIGEPYVPQVVLAVGAHADDIDFGASGSLAAWAKQGAHIEYLVMTDGSKGSSDLAIHPEDLIATRQKEQRAAAKLLGAKEVHFFGYEDGNLELTQELKKRIVKLIRQLRPDTVVVMDPTMVYSSKLGFVNHTDHRVAGQATLDAVYPFTRDHLSFPDLYAEGLKPHKVAHLLLINLEKHNCFIDISETLDLKLDVLCTHVSQIPDVQKVRAMLEARAKSLGQEAGMRYAEGFIRLDLPL